MSFLIAADAMDICSKATSRTLTRSWGETLFATSASAAAAANSCSQGGGGGGGTNPPRVSIHHHGSYIYSLRGTRSPDGTSSYIAIATTTSLCCTTMSCGFGVPTVGGNLGSAP